MFTVSPLDMHNRASSMVSKWSALAEPGSVELSAAPQLAAVPPGLTQYVAAFEIPTVRMYRKSVSMISLVIFIGKISALCDDGSTLPLPELL
jgi:hypothetical protein